MSHIRVTNCKLDYFIHLLTFFTYAKSVYYFNIYSKSLYTTFLVSPFNFWFYSGRETEMTYERQGPGGLVLRISTIFL